MVADECSAIRRGLCALGVHVATHERIPDYGRCPECRCRLWPDFELPELLVCVGQCGYFEPNGVPIKPKHEHAWEYAE